VEVWGEFFQMKFKQDRRRNEKLAGTKIQIGDDRKNKKDDGQKFGGK
jgi:hypothetical protein